MAARQQHAAVLAIGTANPAKCVVAQEEFVDWYFRVTQSDHLPDLKAKMKRMCDKSAIKKRHFYHSEETIAGHPEFINRALPSLDARLGIAKDAVPELAMAAAARAIAEWGRPAADVTHLVVSTNAGAHAPGADARLAALPRASAPPCSAPSSTCTAATPGCTALRFGKGHRREQPRRARARGAALRLEPGKLAASRRVLSEYGNMSCAAIIFVLDELRRRCRRDGGEEEEESDEYCEWGAMVGLGPGLTIETIVLRATGGGHVDDEGKKSIAA
ncbi:hypothetical protein OsJ_34106 [Oryza sativa Japonica Group]|uniref:Chalcone/stilbene synthase N-terminal domain-containing protein n=1 Tax=Oryza sativa subsp. japonica TaxID=39947 RepID=A3CBW4_ORYSJ|nr:hypothetical protein OsJ_34106 [Oryza sativa Japonica Group]